MKMNSSRKAGFTLVEIMIVVAIIGLLAAIAIPNFVRARKTSQTNACINNLRQIDSAKQQWALEQGKKSTDTPNSTSLNVYIGRMGNGYDLYCPLTPRQAWGGYTGHINAVNTLPACGNYDANSHRASLDPAQQ
jgi:prepilin-type N-terminal cleavage/methylation domain-containing protein